MAKSVPSAEAPEFKDPPTPSFYSEKEFPGHYGAGMLSPYGEQLLFVVEYLVKTNGLVDGQDMTQEMVSWADSAYTGRLDHALTQLVENVKEKGKKFPESGADDNQAHCFIKAIPVACIYAGKPELSNKVEEAIRVHQNNDMAVAFGVASARLLEVVLLGGNIPNTLSDLKDVEDQPKQAWNRASGSNDLENLILEMSHELVSDEESPFYNLAGRSCQLPGSFIIPSYFFQRVESQSFDYVKALRENIMRSGDTCSRAILIGAILSDSGPPESWIDKVDKATMERIETAINRLADIAVSDSDEL